MLSKAVVAVPYYADPNLVSSFRGNQFSIYGIRSDGQLVSKGWSGKWQPSALDWFALGGNFLSISPIWTLTYTLGAPIPQIFGVGVDNQAYATSVNNEVVPPVLRSTLQGIGGTFNGPVYASGWGFTTSTAPVVNSETDQAVAIVGLGTDNQPWLMVSNPAFPGWEYPPNANILGWIPLGITLLHEPVIASRSSVSNIDNTFDIFGVGPDRQMYHMVVDGTQWPIQPSTWQPAGGCFISPPAVFGVGGRIDVFGIGSDGRMFHRAWDQGAWVNADWEPLGGNFISPAAVTGGVNPLDVFGIQADNQIYHKWWDGASWQPSQTDWVALGGTFISAPTAVTTITATANPPRLDIFGVGTDNALYHKAWTGGPDFVPPKLAWENIGGSFLVPTIAQLPSQIVLSASVTFSGGTPVGGNAQVTLFNDGTSTFTGNMHDSGFPDYNFSLVCQVTDAQNNAYRFAYSGSVSGTVSLGQSRDNNWTLQGVAAPSIAANWVNFFPCGGLQPLQYWIRADLDTASLLASITTGGLTSVLNVTFQG